MGTVTHTILNTIINMILQVVAVLAFVSATSARSTNIINGEDVDYPGKYPWQISLQMYEQHICGGSIVSETWIMTAGHCVDGAASDMSVVAGMHDMEQRYGSPARYSVQKVIRHASYDNGDGNTANDIAMLKVSPISLNKNAQIIPIDKAGDFDGNSECVITGWGYMIEGRYFVNPDILQETHTTIITPAECAQYWGSSNLNGGMICLRNGKSGGCMGDSGGPLACRNGAGPWTLVGATSWGSAQCQIQMPSVYTRLSYFKDWIKATSGL